MGGEDEGTGERWHCANKIKRKPGAEAEYKIQMLQLDEGSAMIEHQQVSPAALPGHCGSSKSFFCRYKREDKTKELLDNNKYLFFTVSVCFL